MYFCIIKVRGVPFEFFSFPFRRILISSSVEHTVIPLPLLVSYPGLTIQMLRKSLSIFLNSLFAPIRTHRSS